MVITEIFVDPAIAANTGAGTIGDPFGDVRYAIEQTTFDTTNGTRVNVKAGTDEVLTETINTSMADVVSSVAWVPAEVAPVVFQGYTSVQGDGGIGGISGGGSIQVFTNQNYAIFIDMHLHNTGAATRIVDVGNWGWLIRCEVNGSTSTTPAVDVGVGSGVIDCHIYDCNGAIVALEAEIARNYIHDMTGTNKTAIGTNGACYIHNNLVSLNAVTNNGIVGHDGSVITHNSIYQSATGTGYGISSAAGTIMGSILNNLIEGFSGAGGDAIRLDGTNMGIRHWGANSAFNCETAFTVPTLWEILNLGTNEVLASSPFADAAGGDFSPVNVGNVKEGSEPSTFGNGAI